MAFWLLALSSDGWTDGRTDRRTDGRTDGRTDVRTFGRSGRTDAKRENFKRPFTPRGWLGSTRNFGKTRFRRFATFDFSTPKIVFQKNLKFFEFLFDDSLVLEERAPFQRLWQIDREKLLPVVRLFFRYEP